MARAPETVVPSGLRGAAAPRGKVALRPGVDSAIALAWVSSAPGEDVHDAMTASAAIAVSGARVIK